MAQDRTALIHRALRNLGVLPQGQSPSAQEYQSVSDLIDVMFEELDSRNILRSILTNADTIDDNFFVPLGHILAWYAAPEFGSAADAGLAALAYQAEERLKDMNDRALREPPREMRTDYPRTCRTLTLGNWTNGCF